MSQTRRRAAALKEMLVLTGQSALEDADVAAFFGLAGVGAGPLEGYLLSGELDSVISRFGLEADAEGEVFLHVVDQQVSSLRTATALDLYERGTTRERSAGARVLIQVLDRWNEEKMATLSPGQSGVQHALGIGLTSTYPLIR